MHNIDCMGYSRGNALALNRCNSLTYTVRTSKGRAIKGLAVCNNWDLEPLGCHQPSTEVLIVLRVLSNLQAKGFTKIFVGGLLQGDHSFFVKFVHAFFSHLCVLCM